MPKKNIALLTNCIWRATSKESNPDKEKNCKGTVNGIYASCRSKTDETFDLGHA